MIDAHMHFWRLGRGDYDWPTPDLVPLYRDVLPDDAAPLIRAGGVTGVVAVQAAASEAETRFLFELARTAPWIEGVVGWTDLAACDAADRIAALVRDGGGLLKGLRPMLQDMAQRDWIAAPALDAALAAMVAHDLSLDALVRVDQLGALAARAQRTPPLRIVIDHAAKPDIAGNGFDVWAEAMAPLATLPQVHCKLSGLLTEAGEAGPAAMARYVERLLAAFGPERLIWGSDWPVLDLAGDYAAWLAQARELAPHDAIFGPNARAFYRLTQPARLLVLDATDNVGVALADLAAGDPLADGVRAAEPVAFGFKAAVRDIAPGEAVIKYGVPIGSAIRAIAAGELVHLHNMRSDYTRTHTRELEDGT